MSDEFMQNDNVTQTEDSSQPQNNNPYQQDSYSQPQDYSRPQDNPYQQNSYSQQNDNPYQQNSYGQSQGNPYQQNAYGQPQGTSYQQYSNSQYTNNQYYGQMTPQKGDGIGFGLAAMILGILSLFLFACCINYIMAVLAIVFGIVQLVKSSKKGMAIAGIITGAISIILATVFWVYAVSEYEDNQDFYFHHEYNDPDDILDDFMDDLEDEL